MTKQIVAWLIGAAFASSWWLPFVMPEGKQHEEFIGPSIATFVMIGVAVLFFMEHWDD